MQRFNGGKEGNRMTSQGQEKERQLSGAKCGMQGDEQPLTEQHAQMKILEFKLALGFSVSEPE